MNLGELIKRLRDIESSHDQATNLRVVVTGYWYSENAYLDPVADAQEIEHHTFSDEKVVLLRTETFRLED